MTQQVMPLPIFMNELETDRKQLVLVVDDQKRVLRFIEIDLKLRGFDVITTTSGRESLALVRSENPDIMLLDIIMPDMNGFEVLKKLRSFSRIPVIAFSASMGIQEESIRIGADDFAIKPFHPDEMASRIRRLLNLDT